MSSSLPPFPAAWRRVGLANLGNTCFLNVVLQALRMCPPLLTDFLCDPTRTRAIRVGTKKGPLLAAFQALLRDIWTASEAFVMPQHFVGALQQTVAACDDDWYVPRRQADAAECLQYILDGLHDAIYRTVRITVDGQPRNKEEAQQLSALQSWSSFFAKEYSPIVEHFYGQQQIRIRCDSCGSISDRYEPWSSLKLPIPGGDKAGADAPTMAACLDAAHETEQLEDYACETCKDRRPAKITRSISRLPNILIISFKRFTNTGSKIRGLIDWDTEALDLTPWMTFKRHCPFRSEKQHTRYRTFAVIEHHGSSRGGHYRMYGRGGSGSSGSASSAGASSAGASSAGASSDEWIAYDDDSVQGGITRAQVVSPDSYILFLMPVAHSETLLKKAAETLAALNRR